MAVSLLSLGVDVVYRMLATVVIFMVALGCSELEEETCGIPPSSNEECPVSSCAENCDDRVLGVLCCLDQFGYGLDHEDETILMEDCQGGTCDANKHISERAALCIAQVHGLESGVGWCGGAFANSNPFFRWSVINTTYESECTPDSEYFHKSSDLMYVDSLTGVVSEGTSGVNGTGLCP